MEIESGTKSDSKNNETQNLIQEQAEVAEAAGRVCAAGGEEVQANGGFEGG